MEYIFKDKKEEFLINEMIQSSISSGLQTRNQDYPIYNYDNFQLRDARNLRRDIYDYLLNYLTQYIPNNEQQHLEKIKKLPYQLSLKYKHILYKGRFRIGVSQKIINLFLKHMWIIGKIGEPIHCPFDNIIKIKLLKGVNGVSLTDWTEFDQMNMYKKYVQLAENKALESNCSIAVWELENWKNR
jgi:hypothetical protein